MPRKKRTASIQADLPPAKRSKPPLLALARPWTQTYNPVTFADFVGNTDNLQHMHQWLTSFYTRLQTAPASKRCLVLSGPYGVGKSCAVDLLATMLNYDVVRLNAASRESRRAFLDGIRNVLQPSSLRYFLQPNQRHKKTLVLIEEINAIVSSGKGSTELKTLLGILSNAKRPLICITDDTGEDGIRRLIAVAERVSFTLPEQDAIVQRLDTIATAETMYVEPDDLQHIAEQCQGNVRKAVQLLQILSYQQKTQRAASQIENKTAKDKDYLYHRYFDAYGQQALYHALEHYAPKTAAKKRGRRPTKKSCYDDRDKTTQPSLKTLALTGLAYDRNIADISQALALAEHIRFLLNNNFVSEDADSTTELLPYFAYFTCAIPFRMSPVPMPLDRAEFPSHASTCKRYVSNIRSLLARMRKALYNPQYDDARAMTLSTPHSLLLAHQRVFSLTLLAALKINLSKPIIDKKEENGLARVIQYAKRFHIHSKHLDFIYKCATYSGQKRIVRELERHTRRQLERALI